MTEAIVQTLFDINARHAETAHPSRRWTLDEYEHRHLPRVVGTVHPKPLATRTRVLDMLIGDRGEILVEKRCQTSVTVGFVMIVDAVVRRVGQAIDEATR